MCIRDRTKTGNPIYDGIPNLVGVVEEMNKRVMYVKSTSEYILLEKELNDEGKLVDSWLLKNSKQLHEYFCNECFTMYFDGRARKIDPFTIFKESKKRREVYKIGFDPKNPNRKDIFNLYRGFAIKYEDLEKVDKSKCQPLLDHIKKIWCKNNEKSYKYILNLFAHYIRKPDIKTGVMLCLKSKQGAGKGIVLEFLQKIIGDAHYCQNSNANSLFGQFNGVLEGKILVNLDEAFWGGDKALEGQVKNKVTEKRQYINKKNKEAYHVDDYSNYIITTNNDWFSGVDANDRRHYCLELDNEYAGINNETIKKYHKKVRESCVLAFAKVLYELEDFDDFNPREFEKTPLLQDQVERNWNTVQSWFHQILVDGEFRNNVNLNYGKEAYGVNTKKTKKGEIFMFYNKDWLFTNYDCGKYIKKKVEKNEFFKILKNDCLGKHYRECKFGSIDRIKYLHLPDLDIVREEWCNQQCYNYDWIGDDFDEKEFD